MLLVREATGRRGQPGPATARHIRDGNRRFGLSHRGSAATVEGDRSRRPTGEGEAAARRWRPTLNLHLQTCGLLRVEELSLTRRSLLLSLSFLRLKNVTLFSSPQGFYGTVALVANLSLSLIDSCVMWWISSPCGPEMHFQQPLCRFESPLFEMCSP